jgi:hypothetical protein
MNTKCWRNISFAWLKSVGKHKDVETTIYFLVMVKVLEVFHGEILWKQQAYFTMEVYVEIYLHIFL